MYALKIFQKSRPCRGGFTLLEVLASLVLFAIITLGIASTMRETNRIHERVKLRQRTTLSASVALDRLQRDLQMAFNERVQGSPSFFKSSETGLGPTLSFSFLDSPIKTLIQSRTPGLKAALYELKKNEDGSMELVRAEVGLHELTSLRNQRRQNLAGGITELKYEFYDSRNDRWIEKWDTADAATNSFFPKAVKIMMTLVNPDWPKNEWNKRAMRYETSVMILNEMDSR